MAQETLTPDALLDQTNLSGVIADIDEDPDAGDANWLTATDNKSDSICRVSFGSPSQSPTTGAGLQEFRFLIRAANSGGSNVPWAMNLYEGGSDLGQIASGTMGGAETGAVVSGTWNSSSLTTPDGSSVEARIAFTGQAGNPSSRNTGEVGAVEWNAETSAAAQDVAPNGIASGLQLGTPALSTGPVDIAVPSLAPTLAVGQPEVASVGGEQDISVVGIASGLTMGVAALSVGPVNIAGPAISSSLTIGSATVGRGTVDIAATTIDSTLVIGGPSVGRGVVAVEPAGIAPTLNIGSPNVERGAVDIQPASIGSTLVIGSAVLGVEGGGQALSMEGIASTLNIGTPRVNKQGLGPIKAKGRGMGSMSRGFGRMSM